MNNPSKVLKCHAFRWAGVEVKKYKEEDAPCQGVARQTLLGEGPGEEALQCVTRYFEVQPGGYSTLERHQHPHVVVVLHGAGQVVLSGETVPVAPFDCVYVAPGTTHQFQAAGNEPLGFLCIVDRVRDRPLVVR